MRYFTKSRFKVALDCPTKLFYESNPDIYANESADDPFLKALAKGGFQVGKLAQLYYPEGVAVETLDKTEALNQTNELLTRKDVVIFEAAILFQNLFIRVDIIEKKGNKIKLIEVKSKSVDSSTFRDEIWKKAPLKKQQYEMLGTWKPYVYDVAFQAHVAKLAFPKWKIESFLMLTDKRKTTSVEGLNQKFFLKEKGKSHEVILQGDSGPEAIGTEILSRLDVSDLVDIIHSDQELSERFDGRGWHKGIEFLAGAYVSNTRLNTEVGANCKGCNFRCESTGLKSGFKQCWSIDHDDPLVFDVWNYRGSAKALEDGKFLMAELDETDFKGAPVEIGLSNSERQWLQVEKVKNEDCSSFIDTKGLALAYQDFVYPLHMIDFETCMVAIPFGKNQKPYQQIAFQFSHHVIHENGTVEHADEYISCQPGFFPNFEFVRALKKALSKDSGTIFRYSNHENTVLKQIKAQLLESKEKDQKDLINFIDTITDEAPRTMIDLCELVKRYYYSPATHGSNSIKYVLPAILQESEFIKTKYGNKNYNSENFINHQWINIDEDGKVQDPYKTLQPIFDKYDYDQLEMVMSDTDINNGGAALTAYAMMQFTQMSDGERSKVRDALLRYCELDTLGMVMIYEFWKSKLAKKENKSKVG